MLQRLGERVEEVHPRARGSARGSRRPSHSCSAADGLARRSSSPMMKRPERGEDHRRRDRAGADDVEPRARCRGRARTRSSAAHAKKTNSSRMLVRSSTRSVSTVPRAPEKRCEVRRARSAGRATSDGADRQDDREHVADRVREERRVERRRIVGVEDRPPADRSAAPARTKFDHESDEHPAGWSSSRESPRLRAGWHFAGTARGRRPSGQR